MKSTRISIIKIVNKVVPEVLLIRVEVGSERSIIGKIFHKQETLLKKSVIRRSVTTSLKLLIKHTLHQFSL